MDTKNICVICAWRKTCNKKFSMSGKDMNCADFSKDLAIKDDDDEKKDEGSEQ